MVKCQKIYIYKISWFNITKRLNNPREPQVQGASRSSPLRFPADNSSVV